MTSSKTFSVRCTGAGKRFCRNLNQSLWYGLQACAQSLIPFKSQKNERKEELRPGEFWANREITFELKSGECLGLLGRNGAGKTTLLKLLNGILRPDEGRIEVNGRVGAMIALGAGFNPILTGRENIYVNGSILGLTRREINQSIEDIIDFSEIKDAIDSPVRTYSSGMNARLGFAIASSLKPDILIIDEVLAVGDTDFRLKCMKRMRSVINNGCAVILVSHSMTDIRNLAKKTLWLENGRISDYGDTVTVINKYLATTTSEGPEISWPEDDSAPGSPAVRLRQLKVQPVSGSSRISIDSGAEALVFFDCYEEELELGFTIEVATEEQIVVFHTGGRLSPKETSHLGRYCIQVILPGNLLNAGKYYLSIIIDDSQTIALAYVQNAISFKVEIDPVGANYNHLPGIVAPKLTWNTSLKKN